MASGGDAGNAEAPNKKNSKTTRPPVRKLDSEDQANSGVSAQEANDAYNVRHRAAHLHESELTDYQRMQLELMRLTEKLGNLASGEAAAEPPIPTYQSHALDDLESAQLSQEFTEKLLRTPMKFRRQERFQIDPHIYHMDMKTDRQTAEALLKLNTHPNAARTTGTWQANCFPQDGEEPMGYYSPFPGQSAVMDAVDLHITSKPSSLSLNFTLAPGMTHDEFVQRYKQRPGHDGTVKLHIPMATIIGLIKAELHDIDIERTPYHLHALDIAITEENSNFPVAFDKVFTSSSAAHEGMMNSWSTPRGVDASAQNMTSHPGSDDYHRYYNRILPDGASNFSRAPNVGDAVYVGEPCKNGAEFARWINRDWKEIRRDLQKIERDNMYVVKLPHLEHVKDFTFIQWFVLWNMKEIHRRTIMRGEQPVQKAGKDELAFNTMYSSDETGTSYHTLISKQVLDTMLREKEKMFDQEKHLMRLEKTELIIWPMYGWDAYERIATDNSVIMSKAKERVKFSCEVTITFEPFRQAMLMPKAASGSSASSSSSSSHGKAHDAISNSFNSATS